MRPENRVLRAHLPAILRLSNAERGTRAEIGKRLGRKGPCKVAQVARPDTILGWWRKLVAQKFDGSNHRCYPGRPKIDSEAERFIVRMARENSGVTTGSQERWGIWGMKSRTRRSGTCCAGTASRPRRAESDDQMERFHRLAHGGPGGADFFTAEEVTWRGLTTYYVLFVIQLETASDNRRHHPAS